MGGFSATEKQVIPGFILTQLFPHEVDSFLNVEFSQSE